MASDTRHEAVWDWLMTCPYIHDMFFNFSESNNGDTVLVPLTSYNDTTDQEYIDGSTLRYYDFSIVRFEAVSHEPNSGQNLEVLCDVEQIAAWVDTQAAANNYPDFPPGCTVQSVTVLPSDSGYVAARDETGAKYMLQIRIVYRKKGAD